MTEHRCGAVTGMEHLLGPGPVQVSDPMINKYRRGLAPPKELTLPAGSRKRARKQRKQFPGMRCSCGRENTQESGVDNNGSSSRIWAMDSRPSMRAPSVQTSPALKSTLYPQAVGSCKSIRGKWWQDTTTKKAQWLFPGMAMVDRWILPATINTVVQLPKGVTTFHLPTPLTPAHSSTKTRSLLVTHEHLSQPFSPQLLKRSKRRLGFISSALLGSS